jgi:hypothetical protein
MRLVVAIVVVLFVQFDTTVADWVVDVSPPGGITDDVIADKDRVGRATYTNTNSDISKLISIDTIFPRLCKTSSVNEYGWNRWKDSGIIYITPAPKSITIRFRHQPGYAIETAETVYCDLIDPANPSSLHVTAMPNKEVKPPSYSFVVRPGTTDIQVKVEGSVRLASDEGYIRKNGFEYILTLLNGDVWTTRSKLKIFEGIRSLSNGESGILTRLLNLTENSIVIDDATPHQARIFVPAKQIVNFDISKALTITFVPAASTTLKGKAPIAVKEKDALVVNVPAFEFKPNLVFTDASFNEVADVLELREDCIRGLNATSPPCSELRFQITVSPGNGYTIFTPLDDDARDAMPSAFTSAADSPGLANVSAKLFKRMQLQTGTNGDIQNVLVVYLNAIPDLDVASPASFDFKLPFNVLKNREPPNKSGIKIRITPSGAHVKCTATDIKQDAIWTGGVTFNITLDGETWDQPAVLAGFINATTTVYSDVKPNEATWKQWRSAIVPSSAIAFPTPRVMTVTFVQNVEYALDSDYEMVSFELLPRFLTSRTPPQDVVGNQMKIEIVPPTLVVNGNRSFHERDVWAGTVSFVLTLAGERWRQTDFETLCGSQIAGGITTDANLVDDHGWRLASVRNALMDGAVNAPEGRNLRVRWKAHSAYDVVRGETLTITVPKACMSQDRAELRGRPTISIAPQSAVIDAYFVDSSPDVGVDELVHHRLPVPLASIRTGFVDTHPDVGVEELMTITESRVRTGGITLVLNLTYDRFNATVLDSTMPSLRAIVAHTKGSGVEATGWNQKRNDVVAVANVTLLEAGRVLLIPFQFYAPFGVSSPERVWFEPEPSWLRSNTEPESVVAFYVDVSPGLVTIPDWTGKSEAVIENQLRKGTFFLSLKLLGDSWSSDRVAYSLSLVANQTDSNVNVNGIDAARFEVIPGMEFWEFGSAGGFATLLVTFQRAHRFDISTPETVIIKLDNKTVASRLPPSWLYAGAEKPYFAFTVQPTPGELHLSGNIHRVSEQTLRRQQVVVRVRLTGETFAIHTGIIASLVGGLTSDTLGSAFDALKDRLLSTQGNSVEVSESELVMRFGPWRDFVVPAADTVSLRFARSHFASTLLPAFESPHAAWLLAGNASVDTLRVPLFRIAKSGGEIRAVVNESISRDNGIEFSEVLVSHNATAALSIDLILDGDSWAWQAIETQPATFLLGFTSLTPIYTEPHGFLAHRYDLLQLALPKSSLQLINPSTVRVFWCGACGGSAFDLQSVDDVVFRVSSSSFVQSNVLPVPNALTIRVTASPRWIAVELGDAASDNAFWSGVVTATRFKTQLGAYLSVPTLRVEVKGSAFQTPQRFAFRFVDVDADQLDDVSDARTSAVLHDLFWSVNQTMLRQTMGAVVIYQEEQGRPAEALPPPSMAPGALQSTSQPETLSDKVTAGMWIGGLIVLVVIGIAAFNCANISLRRSTPVGMLIAEGAGPHVGVELAAHADERTNFLAGDETFTTPLDEHRHYSGQRSTQRSNPLLQQFDKAKDGLRAHVRHSVLASQSASNDQHALGRGRRTLATQLNV